MINKLWVTFALFQTFLILYGTYSHIDSYVRLEKTRTNQVVNSYRAGCYESKKDKELNCKQESDKLRSMLEELYGTN